MSCRLCQEAARVSVCSIYHQGRKEFEQNKGEGKENTTEEHKVDGESCGEVAGGRAGGQQHQLECREALRESSSLEKRGAGWLSLSCSRVGKAPPPGSRTGSWAECLPRVVAC